MLLKNHVDLKNAVSKCKKYDIENGSKAWDLFTTRNDHWEFVIANLEGTYIGISFRMLNQIVGQVIDHFEKNSSR